METDLTVLSSNIGYFPMRDVNSFNQLKNIPVTTYFIPNEPSHCKMGRNYNYIFGYASATKFRLFQSLHL